MSCLQTAGDAVIRYDLRCSSDHPFDSWFQSSEGYERLRLAGQISCPTCGATDVTKGLMAPAVRPAKTLTDAARQPSRAEVEAALVALRRKIEASSDYVGPAFAAEARAIHAGDAPERPIYGEARADEARSLIDDGIPVAPLPFIPVRKTN